MLFRKVINDVIEKCDIILELLDARFIDETRNEAIENRILNDGKVLIYVINKIDLVKSQIIHDKIRGLKPYALISCKERLNTGALRNLIFRYASKDKDVRTRVGIIGYPNTGKSSLVNVLCGKAKAPTSPQSGMTRGAQFIRLTENITLFDTPGTFIMKDEDKLILISSIDFSKAEDPVYYVNLLEKKFPGFLEDHYGVEDLEELARKRGHLRKGGEVDEEKTARIILKDWQQGKIRV